VSVQREYLKGKMKVHTLSDKRKEFLHVARNLERVIDKAPIYNKAIYRGMHFESEATGKYKVLKRQLDSGRTFTFDSILNKEPVGETVRIAFLRNGQRSEANLTTEAMPRNLNNISPWNGPLFRAPEEMEWMGLEVSLLTAKIARKRQLPIDEKGLYVIEADGIAGASGIVPGDIIKSINRMPITDFNSYNEAIKRVNLNDGIVLQVSRMGRHSFVALQ
ncbi:hypothetical protein LCGC14_2558250, partial [marine sediment metagenome]